MNNHRMFRMLAAILSKCRVRMSPYKCMVKTTVYLEEEIANSLIAVAERLRVDRILTVAERDFRVVRSSRNFEILPGAPKRRRG
jgi:hypothetical protein